MMGKVVSMSDHDVMARKIRWNLGRAESFTEQAHDALSRCGALSEDWREEFRTDVDEIKNRLDQIREIL
jgi:hypothetical protein